MPEKSTKQKIDFDYKHIAHVALMLFIISVVAAALLGYTNSITKAKIAQQEKETNVEARQKVLTKADTFKRIKNAKTVAKKADHANASIVMEAYAGYQKGKLVGYTVKTNPQGYGGEVEILTGVDTRGKTTGMTIVSNSETAGLGAKCVEPDFQKQFKGLDTAKPLAVVKNGNPSGNGKIEAIAGATITSRAVTRGVNISMKVCKVLAGGAK